ncbi:hypothetical protein ES703_77112 [subsurface metagenome]
MARGISETAFSSQVEDLLKMFGWHWCHFRPALTGAGWRTAMTGKKGITDYIAARPPRLIFAELKDEVKGNTPEQEEWQNILRQCQRVILNQPMTVQGKMATLILDKPVDMLMTPEVYLWRPSQIEEIARILR